MGEIHTKLPARWSCLKPPRLDKHHQKSISPRLSHPFPPPSFPGTPPPFPPHPPHHFIIVSGRATRLVDTQSGKRGAMMNCSLLVLSRMIIINFPPAPAGGRGTGAGEPRCSGASSVGPHPARHHHLSQTEPGPKAKR